MSDEQIRDAAGAVFVTKGGSAFIHGVNTDLDLYKEKLVAAVERIKADDH